MERIKECTKAKEYIKAKERIMAKESTMEEEHKDRTSQLKFANEIHHLVAPVLLLHHHLIVHYNTASAVWAVLDNCLCSNHRRHRNNLVND